MDNIYSADEDLKKIKKAILRSQRCQRNWDLDKQLSDEQLDMILFAATECPTKQNIPFYSVKVLQDRESIEAIYELTFGPNPSDESTGKKNPQVLANTLLVFTQHDFEKDIGKNRSPETAHQVKSEEDLRIIRDDTLQAIGIAAGYVNMTASMLGLQTGCCKCMCDKDAIQRILCTDEKPMLLMGVGFKDTEKGRREHHLTSEIMPTYNKKISVDIL